jgi:tetratricopeptide (TPR) repeat protein
MCPTVYVGDSGELTAAAHSLGIPHNSGYPLYALLGKIFCLVPFGSAGFRVNLMSAVLSALTVALLHDLLFKLTASGVASISAACFLGFTSLFWMQAVSAEVYALHLFFVTLTLKVLWWWDQSPDFRKLMLLAFVVGLSFCNHLQTVMLAPALLWIIGYREGGVFPKPRNLVLLCLVFLLALSIYLYLPFRTEAGAAITWGDPNTLQRFLDHALAKAHRSGYVMNRDALDYARRTWEALANLWVEFGFFLLFAFYGWCFGLQKGWRSFYLLVILFDLSYAIFLNTVSLEITPFALSTLTVLTILSGIGVADILKRIRGSTQIGARFEKAASGAFILIPLVPLLANIDYCNQSRNYAAYEHAVNILRTTGKGSVLFIDGDNNVFPVIYARICEGMGEDVRILDRFNLVFRWNSSNGRTVHPSLNSLVERMVRENDTRGVYLSVFDPNAFPLPQGFRLIPYGVLTKIESEKISVTSGELDDLWNRYSTLSFHDAMGRDYMHRQVSGYFHFYLGRHYFQSGSPKKGLKSIRTASLVAYNDEMIHSDIGVFLTEQRLFDEARLELESALKYAENAGMVHNNFGYFYNALGDHEKSVASLRKSVELEPRNRVYLNNLGFALLNSGRKEEAVPVLSRSLEVEKEQPHIRSVLEELTESKNSRFP